MPTVKGDVITKWIFYQLPIVFCLQFCVIAFHCMLNIAIIGSAVVNVIHVNKCIFLMLLVC